MSNQQDTRLEQFKTIQALLGQGNGICIKVPAMQKEIQDLSAQQDGTPNKEEDRVVAIDTH